MGFIVLSNGRKMPQIGLGTWTVTDKNVLLNALEAAYQAGYRAIDTATIYENEEIIGEFLKKHNRDEIFITTKLWNKDHNNVLEAINTSLEKLGTDYVDLYLIHWPVNFNGEFDLEGVWKQMEEVVEKGKAKSIGVSNFGIKNLTKLLGFCRIKPVMVQLELHPYLPQDEIRKFCKTHGINVTSYSSLGSSFGGKCILTDDPVLKEIAKSHDCPVQSVILNFLQAEGIFVIPRSTSKKHIESNIQQIELSEEEKNKIREIKTRCRYIDVKEFGEHRFD